jgi:hypothetical protein
MRRVGKRGELQQQYAVELILAVLIVILFVGAAYQKADDRNVKQQVLEKQMALLIESASPGMKFYISKVNYNGYVSNVKIENGRVYVDVDGLPSIIGYSFFTRYLVDVSSDEKNFIVEVKG